MVGSHVDRVAERRPPTGELGGAALLRVDGGGLDGLPYALAAGPEMARILRDIYDIDFFNPPAEAHGIGVIPSSYNRRIWEAYSQERWQEIRHKYNVSQVMTYNDWTLRLPIVAQNARYLLYEIPE